MLDSCGYKKARDDPPRLIARMPRIAAVRLQVQRQLQVDVVCVLGATVVREGLFDIAAAEVPADPKFHLRGGNGIPTRGDVDFLAELVVGAAGGVPACVPEYAADVVPEVRGRREPLQVTFDGEAEIGGRFERVRDAQ